MSQIKVSLYDQTAVFTETPDIFSGDIDVDTVKFTFDNSWNVYNKKTAIFYNDPKKSYPVFLDDTNTAVIPSAVIDRGTKLCFGVIGTNANNEVKTSSILSYRIERGAISADVEIPPSSAEIWLQILLNYEIALKKLQDMSNNLENMNNTLEEMNQRFIDANVENKANISLNNLNKDGINKLLTEVNLDTIKGGTTYKKYYIQSGTVALNIGAFSSGISVTFPVRYKLTPIVIISESSFISSSSFIRSMSAAYNVTADSFILTANAQTGGGFNPEWLNNMTVNWIALGEIDM